MIPQAISNVGPYADLWSYLKSMQHALNRAVAGQNLMELDKERLSALARFLRGELSQEKADYDFNFAGLSGQEAREPKYSLDLDLQQLLKKLPEFDNWHAPQKLGFERKWLKLISALETYGPMQSGRLLPVSPPREEFQVLQTILAELLLHTESSLQA